MEIITENLTNIALVLGTLYPALLFLLPANIANKISLGVKVIKTVADTLEKAKDTKAGLSLQDSTKTDIKIYTQKAKN